MEIAIKRIRKSCRISQTELAEQVGVNLRTVGAWERGETLPNAAQILACAVAMGTDPNDILGWYEDHPRMNEADDSHHEIVGPYNALSDEGREVAVNVVEGLAASYPRGAADAGNCGGGRRCHPLTSLPSAA